jgi:hypothetical protein
MKNTAKIGILAATAMVAMIGLAPVSARADSLQTDKNNMRNLAILGGAAALYGLADHNSGLALIGAAGAAIAGSQYEQDRHIQSQEQSDGYYYYGDNDPSYNGDYRGDDHRATGDRDDRRDRGDGNDRGRDNHGNWNDQGRSDRGN